MAGEDAELRRQLALGAEGRADVAQQAELFGRVRPAGAGGPEVTTLGGRQASLQEELARSADERADLAQQSELFGKIRPGGAGGPEIQTLGGMQALEGLRGSRLAREATEAGLTGQFGGAATVAEQNRLDALKTQDLQRRLATAGATGQLDLGGSQQPVTTLQAQALEQEMQGQALNRALQRAGATGEFIEEGATGVPQETLESRLRTAQLTGDLGGQQTLAGRQAEMDQVGAILAALDPEMKGRTDPLAEALGADLQQAEQSRRKFEFDQEVNDLIESDDFNVDAWFQLMDKYNDMPGIAESLETIMNEDKVRRKIAGTVSEVN
jgi:hypothetical protein